MSNLPHVVSFIIQITGITVYRAENTYADDNVK